jgi:hypothetical protein
MPQMPLRYSGDIWENIISAVQVITMQPNSGLCCLFVEIYACSAVGLWLSNITSCLSAGFVS